jgi:anti-sigma factor RsiW
MNSIDLHPEELLDRVRRGQASAADRERVHEHLRSCEACRFEHALLQQSTRDGAPHPGDGARARRIEQAAAAALAARGVLAASASPRRGRGRRAGALLAAGVASSLATAAAAAVITQPAWLGEWLPVASSAPPAPEASPRRAKRARAHGPVAPAAAPAPEPELAPPAPVQLQPEPSARPAGTRPDQTHRGAAELFAAANEARREGEPKAAVQLYRELARAHPRSEEARVARVALGRLLLDRLGDARGALREFTAYLTDPGQRALREDALIGKALALGRLGRAREERAAWDALLAAFPASAYAERARARVQELRCAAEPC